VELWRARLYWRKREISEDHRGRDFSRRDWDHDDDEDFQQNRRHGTRRHRSLSGWARSSRCRGGPEDHRGRVQAEGAGRLPHSVVVGWLCAGFQK
jgi:hypothetical protein